MRTWNFFFANGGAGMLTTLRHVLVVSVLACAGTPGAWAQGATIQTNCGGALNAKMAQIAAPYRQAVVALNGSVAGWCAVAAEHDASTALGAASWEFVSAAYLMNALKGHVQITSSQRAALQKVLVRVPGMGEPPTSRRDIDNALYVWARTLAAEDSGAALVAIDGLEQFAPAVHRTLMRRSGRWGDADGN